MRHNILPMEKQSYTAPEIEVLDITVERGFANTLENPEIGPEQGWDK